MKKTMIVYTPREVSRISFEKKRFNKIENFKEISFWDFLTIPFLEQLQYLKYAIGYKLLREKISVEIINETQTRESFRVIEIDFNDFQSTIEDIINSYRSTKGVNPTHILIGADIYLSLTKQRLEQDIFFNMPFRESQRFSPIDFFLQSFNVRIICFPDFKGIAPINFNDINFDAEFLDLRRQQHLRY